MALPMVMGRDGIATGLLTYVGRAFEEDIADRDYPFNVRVILFGAEEIGCSAAATT